MKNIEKTNNTRPFATQIKYSTRSVSNSDFSYKTEVWRVNDFGGVLIVVVTGWKQSQLPDFWPAWEFDKFWILPGSYLKYKNSVHVYKISCFAWITSCWSVMENWRGKYILFCSKHLNTNQMKYQQSWILENLLIEKKAVIIMT